MVSEHYNKASPLMQGYIESIKSAKKAYFGHKSERLLKHASPMKTNRTATKKASERALQVFKGLLLCSVVALLMSMSGCLKWLDWGMPRTIIADTDTLLLDSFVWKEHGSSYKKIELRNVDYIPDWVYEQKELEELHIFNDANSEDFREVNTDTIWLEDRFFQLQHLRKLVVSSYHMELKTTSMEAIHSLTQLKLTGSTIRPLAPLLCRFPNLEHLNLFNSYAQGGQNDLEKQRCSLKLRTLDMWLFESDLESDYTHLMVGAFRSIRSVERFIRLDKDLLQGVRVEYLDVAFSTFRGVDTTQFIRQVNTDTLVISSCMLSDSVGTIDCQFKHLMILDMDSGVDNLTCTIRVRDLIENNKQLNVMYSDGSKMAR